MERSINIYRCREIRFARLEEEIQSQRHLGVLGQPNHRATAIIYGDAAAAVAIAAGKELRQRFTLREGAWY